MATMLENLESASHYDLSGSDGLQHGLSQGQDSIMRHLGLGVGVGWGNTGGNNSGLSSWVLCLVT